MHSHASVEILLYVSIESRKDHCRVCGVIGTSHTRPIDRASQEFHRESRVPHAGLYVAGTRDQTLLLLGTSQR